VPSSETVQSVASAGTISPASSIQTSESNSDQAAFEAVRSEVRGMNSEVGSLDSATTSSSSVS
jgi:hypothetical protein